jgi:hypothetical protein
MQPLPNRLQHLAPLLGIPKQNIERRPRRTIRDAHWIYVVRCESFVKIGLAGDPVARIKDMQVGNPFPLVLVMKLWTDHPKRDERALHHALKHHQERGEWFRISDAFDALLESWCRKSNKVPKH